MAKQNWLSKKESARRTLLNNLADKLPGTYATKYGITADELTGLATSGSGSTGFWTPSKPSARRPRATPPSATPSVTAKAPPPARSPCRPP